MTPEMWALPSPSTVFAFTSPSGDQPPPSPSKKRRSRSKQSSPNTSGTSDVFSTTLNALSKRVPVLIDTREPATVRLAIQAALLPGQTQNIALREGDFAIPDRDNHLMGVERKTVSDILASIRDGRFVAQTTRMGDAYSIQMVLIEGIISLTGDGRIIDETGFTTGWKHASLQMALYAVQRRFPNLVILWVPSLGGTADVIRTLADRGSRGCFDASRMFGPTPTPHTTAVTT